MCSRRTEIFQPFETSTIKIPGEGFYGDYNGSKLFNYKPKGTKNYALYRKQEQLYSVKKICELEVWSRDKILSKGLTTARPPLRFDSFFFFFQVGRFDCQNKPTCCSPGGTPAFCLPAHSSTHLLRIKKYYRLTIHLYTPLVTFPYYQAHLKPDPKRADESDPTNTIPSLAPPRLGLN